MTPPPTAVPGLAGPVDGQAEISAPVVRLAHGGDLARLAELERQCFEPPWSAADLAALLESPNGRVLLLEASTGPVAYGLFQQVLDEAELLRLGVTATERSRGFATLLLVNALRELANTGVRRCHLEVRADNFAALAVYRRLGFVQTGQRIAYYGKQCDALLMAREI